jgi:predicted ester cyclase
LEENKSIVCYIMADLFNQGDLSLADKFIAPEFLDHSAPSGMNNRGPGPLSQIVMTLRMAFPDLHYILEEIVAEGEMVAARVTMSGTHLRPFLDLSPTGRSVRMCEMHFFRIKDGKAIEHWEIRDDLGLMQQLGVIPTPLIIGKPTTKENSGEIATQ